MMKKVYTLALSLFAIASSFAQTTITYECNALRAGDEDFFRRHNRRYNQHKKPPSACAQHGKAAWAARFGLRHAWHG